MRRWCLLCVILLAGCQPSPQPSDEQPIATAAWPPHDYRGAAANGMPVWRVVPGASRVDLVVRREGPLARFGHDHVISANAIHGWLLAPTKSLRARGDLRISVEQLVIDPREARARHDVVGNPSQDDIEGTGKNLHAGVLQSNKWPYVIVALNELRGGDSGQTVLLSLTLNGRTQSQRVPVTIRQSGLLFTAVGELTITQSDHGIKPFSVLGGGLRVADEVRVFFNLVAQRARGRKATCKTHAPMARPRPHIPALHDIGAFWPKLTESGCSQFGKMVASN